MFPIRSVQGDVIGFGGRVLDRGEPKYLNSPETPVFVKGRELYGLFEARTAIRQRGYALVVEGYMDVVALAQLGLRQRGRDARHGLHRRACAKAVPLHRRGRLQLRRRRRRPPRRRPRARGQPAARQRHAQRPLPVPARRARPGLLRARARRRGVRARVGGAVPLSRQIVARPREGCDLATAEGRARFLANAQPLWTALPEGMLKRQMLGEIAARAAPRRPTSWPRCGASAARRAAGAAPPPAAGVRPPVRRAARPSTPGDPPAADRVAWLLLLRERLVGDAERRRPCPALRPARLALAKLFRLLDREIGASTARQPLGGAARTRSPTRARGARRRWPWSTARIRRSSRCSRTCRSSMTQLAARADQKRAAAQRSRARPARGESAVRQP